MKKDNSLLRAARIYRKWTTEFVSKQVGVSHTTYMRWEMGIQIPRNTSLNALCKIFSLSPAELGFVDFPTFPSSQQYMAQAQTDSAHVHVQTSVYIESSVDSGNSGEERDKQPGAENSVEEPGISAPIPSTQHDTTPMLDVWTEDLALYWKQYMNGEQVKLEHLVPTYIAYLHRPTLTPGPDQRLAASLMSQTYQLIAMLQLQLGNSVEARQNGTQAVVYGQLARDWNVYVAAQMRLALIFSSGKRLGAALVAYNDALRFINTYSDSISPILHSRIFAGLADIQATMGREQEARQLLKLALTVFPAHPEDDPCFSYTHYDRSMLYLYEGIVFLRLGLTRHAWDAFSQVDTLTPMPEKRTRAEFLKYRAYTSLVLGNMTQCCIYLEAAARAAQEISSDLTFGEVYAIYEHMLAVWGQEQRVRSLAKLFQM
jgi:tetratricopeptide (TPR) repeat protein/transcriptional regulator with XRE-family HTH domain